MNYWIFQGNPNRINMDAYLSENHRITWSVNQKHFLSKIKKSDQVFMWRAAGSGKAGEPVAKLLISSLH